jgi:zinc protease
MNSPTAGQAAGIPMPARAPAYYPAWVQAASARVSMLDLPGKNLCALRLSWPYGSAAEPADCSGITLVAIETAVAGAGGELPDLLHDIGAELTATVTADATAVTLVTPAWCLETAVTMTVQALSRPSFRDEDVAHIRSRAAARARDTLARPAVLAWQELLRAIYGRKSGFSRHPAGSPDAIRALTGQATRHHYWDQARPAGVCLNFAGDITSSRAAPLLRGDLLANLLSESAQSPEQASLEPESGPWTVLVHRSLPQPVLAVGQLVQLRSLREVTALEVAVAALAGWHGSRWHLELRERRGLSYGSSTDFTVRARGDRYLCQIAVITAVAPDRAATAVTCMRAELDNLVANGISDGELRQAISWLVQSEKLYLQVPDQIAARHAQHAERGLPPGYGAARARQLTELSAADVAAAASRLAADQLVVAAIGDSSAVGPALEIWESDAR